MPRISSIFEGFIPPPTPGAALPQTGNWQRVEETTGKEKLREDVRPTQSLALPVDEEGEGVEDVSGHRGFFDNQRMSSVGSIDETSDHQSNVSSSTKGDSQGHFRDKLTHFQDNKKPNDENSSENEVANMLPKRAKTSTTPNIDDSGSESRQLRLEESAIVKRKRGRPSKTDNSPKAQQAQPQKKQRVNVDMTMDDAGAIQAQLEDTVWKHGEGHEHNTEGDGDVETMPIPLITKEGRGRLPKDSPKKIKAVPGANSAKRGRGRPPKIIDNGDPYPDEVTPDEEKEHPRKTGGKASSHERQDLSTESVPKRGRGRPRKPVDPNAPVPDPNTPKRGRGRPRKIVDPNAPSPDLVKPRVALQEQGTSTLKESGRQPGKTEASDAQVGEIAQQATPAKKRLGRPSQTKALPNTSETARGTVEKELGIE